MNFACEAGSSHTHIVGTATIASALCHTGYDHDHSGGVEESSAEEVHVHNVIGNTEEEGEPVDGSDTLYAKFDVGQDSAELLGKFEAQATAELLGKANVTHSAELLSNFRVKCPRLMGGNWQRKMWFDGTYYWRGRYCPTDDALKFEYIAAAGLAGNTWTENAAARINAAGFTGIDADFTVRGGQSGIPTTIHYSDGVDTSVAESDEASLTGWAWENTTTVFTGVGGDTYRKVNLGANRKAINPILWVCAVFVDVSEGTQYVVTREQSTSGDITGWDAAVDVSVPTNTNTIYGCSLRSMGAAGAEADDVMWIYKEGIALRSRYYTGVVWQAIQDIDTTTFAGKAKWDFEHGEIAGENEGHIVYVDADGSVQWRERAAGAAVAWSAAEELHAAIHTHYGVGIVEHGSGWLWVIWINDVVLEYRVHLCATETWFPLLANPPLAFDPSTEGVITTSTDEQPQTPDSIPSGEAVPICWIGETAPATPCEVGWGILVEYSIGSLKGILDVRQLTSTDLYARLEVGQGSAELLGRFEAQASAELLGKFEARTTLSDSAELLGKAEVQQSGSAELLGKFESQVTAELLGKA
ncbi:MAG: hypothetical protein KAT53_05395, partial [Dehalococcoidia bacterium]|nr:hypothetical protein [Dehalococcoidia bacterium]